MMPSAVRLESAACPLGCAPNDAPVLTARDRIHDIPGDFPVVRCRTCGLLRTNPRPTPDTIGFYYPDDYGPYLGTQVAVRREAGPVRKLLRAVYRTVFRFNTELVPPLPPGRMLEVGCASGAYLARMAAEGWQVKGMEFSESAAARARQAGFDVRTGPLESAQEEPESFDLIVGWMVIEHLHDPLAGLRKLHGWARPGGWLCVSVPNAAALEFRLFGADWYALHIPAHLYHFTPETLTALLARAGWTVERVFHQRNINNLIASTGNWLESRGAPAFLWRGLKAFPDRAGRWSLLLYPIAWLFSLFGQTGRMTVWARKRGG